MSLTSYRAAPPCVTFSSGSRFAFLRSRVFWDFGRWIGLHWCVCVVVSSGADRSGGGLLSRGLSLSIIGAGAFHGRVRDGIGCRHSALEPPDRQVSEEPWDDGCQDVTSVVWTRRYLEPSLGTGKMSFVEVEAIKPIERLVRLS